MRVLVDSCVSKVACQDLRAGGHDVEWCGDWPSDPGDDEILRRAGRDGRVLITIDKGFGELAVRAGRAHHGIIRLVGFRARQQGPIAAEILTRYADDLAQGAIVTVEPDRVRIRSPR